jgi:PAS domain S-box-containing protein
MELSREEPIWAGEGRAAQPVKHASAEQLHLHAVQFYEDESYLATVVGEFLADGLKAGQPVIVVATPAHRTAFVRQLGELGIDVAAARGSGQFQLLDARETLAKFTVGTERNVDRFNSTIGSVIARGLRGREGTAVRAYGEMVDVLWKDGDTAGAIQVEQFWNALAKHHHFALLCAYSMGSFCRASDADAFLRVCGEHSHVLPTESYTALDERAKLLEISRLQQRARALEAEVAERERVEQRLRETVLTLNEREAQLRDHEADLRDLLENAAEGIHLVGPDGTIEWANAAELEMLGYDADEYIGRSIAEFHVDAPVIRDILSRLVAGETLRGVEVRLRHKDGSVRYAQLSSNVRWREGEFVHTRCFTRDVTQLRLAAQAREEALAAEHAARLDADRARREAEEARAAAEEARAVAEHANRAKSEFLAVMSHELLTPLNAIGGYTELLEMGIHGEVTPAQREAFERIQRSQRSLLGLINQVLNYARIETGTVRYNLGPVSVGAALRSAEALMAPHLRAKGLRFEITGAVDRVFVRADEERFQQILLNLFSNAVKFTDRGGLIRVDVDATPQLVRLHVSDSGIGIPREKLGVIFEPFVQVDPNYTRTHEGVGLGLAISRDLARGMDGDLTVSSIEGEGSRFTLALPGDRAIQR